MRILLLSFYYPPDLGPGSLRAKSIVDALQAVSEETGLTNVSIDVLTTLPNRYESMDVDTPDYEQAGNTTIQSFPVPKHKSRMVDQSRSFIVYASSVQRQVKGETYDIVIATSSRLLTASLGAWVALKSQAKLYLDIRDLFTDSLKDVLPKGLLWMVLPVICWLERWTFRRSSGLNVVSAGFLPHMQVAVPAIQPSVLTNGVDEEFLARDFSSKRSNEKPIVLYAGNMGEGQGLHNVIPSIAKSLEGQVVFRLLGDGGRKVALVKALTDSGIENVELLNPVSREDLLALYRQSDVLFLHLNHHPAFRKVLPSKIFEYAATGKPILAGVAGYAADFLHEHVPGVAVFPPCNAGAMELGLQKLLKGPKFIDRREFCERFRRKTIMQTMAAEILALGSGRR